MKATDFFVLMLYATALYVTIIFLYRAFWLKTINLSAAMEWFWRGYSFSLGALTATFTMLFVIKLIMVYTK